MINSIFYYLFLISVTGALREELNEGINTIPFCCEIGPGETVDCNNKKVGNDYIHSSQHPKPMPYFISQKFKLNIHHNNFWTTYIPNCKSTKYAYQTLNIGKNNSGYDFTDEGYLIIRGKNESEDYYHTSQYCINKLDNSEVTIKYCSKECSTTEPCIRSCCPFGQIFLNNPNDPGCTEGSWIPPIYKKLSDRRTLINQEEWYKLQPKYYSRPPQSWTFANCENNGILAYVNNPKFYEELNHEGIFELNYRLDSNGKLRVRYDRKWEKVRDNKYCISGVLNSVNPDAKFDPRNSILFLCIDQTIHMEFNEQQQSEYYGIVAIFASFFALFTVIVYFLLFEKQNIHGWVTMSHSTAAFFLFLFIGLAHITNEGVDIRGTTLCKFIATAAHYFFIATFAWLLVLSLDLWLTFRTVNAPRGGRGGKRLGRFLSFSAFGWGLPGVVVGVSWALEAKFRDDPERGFEESEVSIPRYGEHTCYVSRSSLWEFMYGPAGILLLINLILFAWTTITLYNFQKSTAFAMKNINKERQSFGLFVKLFIICGVLWITELLGFSISGAHITWYIQIADSCNILQPVAIFAIFILKAETINDLHEKYTWIRPIVFPARYVILYMRNRNKYIDDGAPLHTKGFDTQTSRVSTLEEKNSVL